MKDNYEAPDVILIQFAPEDIIATSGCSGTKTEQNNEVLGTGGCTNANSGDYDSNFVPEPW